MKIVRKALWYRLGKGSFFIASVSSFVGFLLLLVSIQSYTNISRLFDAHSDLLGGEILILNKKTSLLNTLSIASTSFLQKDIEELQALPEVQEVVPFLSSNYRVMGTLAVKGLPYLSTDLFFEAVDDGFVDVAAKHWEWTPQEETVPIVLPKNYLHLYNFGFAPSRGLPTIPESMFGMLSFKLSLSGNGKKHTTSGRIVGFTERLNTILVPKSFLIWSNERFAKEVRTPSRVILKVNHVNSPELLKLLEKRGYETNQEKLKNSKLSTLLKMALMATTSIALIIMVLSLTVFISAFQLIITKSSRNIQMLIQLGYYYPLLCRKYIQDFLVIITVIGVAGFASFWFLQQLLAQALELYGFSFSTKLSLELWVVGIGVILLVLIFNSFFIFRKVRGLALKSG